MQYTSWNDKENLATAMGNLELDSSLEAIQNVVDALTPYEIIAARYGHGDTWHNFTGPHLTRLAAEIENRKDGITVDNRLMGGADPCYGTPKQLEITVRRLAVTRTLAFNEYVILKRSDLWIS